MFAISMVRTTPRPAVRMADLVSANRTQFAIWSRTSKAPSVGFAPRWSSAGWPGVRAFLRLGRNGLDSLDGPAAGVAPLGVRGEPVRGPGGGGGDGVLGGVPVSWPNATRAGGSRTSRRTSSTSSSLTRATTTPRPAGRTCSRGSPKPALSASRPRRSAPTSSRSSATPSTATPSAAPCSAGTSSFGRVEERGQ